MSTREPASNPADEVFRWWISARAQAEQHCEILAHCRDAGI